MQHFELNRSPIPYSERVVAKLKKIILPVVFMGILWMVGTIASVGIAWWISLLLYLFISLTWAGFYVRTIAVFIQKIEIKEMLIVVTYSEKDELKTMEASAENTKLWLRDTTRKMRYTCRLYLTLHDDEFVLESQDDWSFKNIHDLFVAVKEFKNEPWTEEEAKNIELIKREMAK